MVLWIIVPMFLYCLPAFVAVWRDHRNLNSIVVVNIFLGWTFVGWVIALAWAFMS
jgi:hypothetical protein